MANIVDYIKWRGDLEFKVDPFNSVDNLILARLCYIEFDDLEPKGETLKSIASRYIDSEIKMNPGLLLNEGNKPLLEGAGLSKRFGNIVIKNFVSKIDPSIQLQFSAVTYEIDNKTAYIAFRGTDDTLVGWKEDFNMSFMDVVPAQIEAAKYLNDVIDKDNYKNIYIGGHSKGGNLSVYSAVKSKKSYKHRIKSIYSNDGPGFKTSLTKSPEYKLIADKIIPLVPQSSIVGLLMEHEGNYKVVKSNEKGIMQHDGFSWEVEGNDFIYLKELSHDAKMLKRTSTGMLNKMSLEEREIFASVLFKVLSVEDSNTLTDLKKGGITSLFKMAENYNKIDWETKKMILKTVSVFIDEGYKSFKEISEISQWWSKVKTRKNEITSDITKEIEDFFK